jgi:hypothetical protein
MEASQLSQVKFPHIKKQKTKKKRSEKSRKTGKKQKSLKHVISLSVVPLNAD